VVRELPNANQFVAYIDAIGELDGTRCLMDWMTATSRYPEEPAGLLSLDPQLIRYSWMTGISEVALVVFVRKPQPEIQYLKTSISEEQRVEFGRLVATEVGPGGSKPVIPSAGVSDAPLTLGDFAWPWHACAQGKRKPSMEFTGSWTMQA
jgi:hypothetical protein